MYGHPVLLQQMGHGSENWQLMETKAGPSALLCQFRGTMED
jgi:hypothetical protein